MAGNSKLARDQKNMVKFLITTVESFIQDRLIDKDQRTKQKEQCAERLAAEDGTPNEKDTEVRYSDQAVLANLDWGIDALEEAINTSNMETKLARLDYAEKMLQVCAMLDSSQRTAGVPNFYLSAWAHLNLSYLWKLRNNVHNAVLHVLEMFIVDPFFSRIDFAPELWKDLFLPHMGSIVGWYTQERQRLVLDVIPDSNDLSFTFDFDQYFNESLIFSMRPDQAEKLQKLEQLYGQSLDENTILYANYYKDCMNCDSTTCKKVVPMLPIAEPPMTPLHEVSKSIPDFVKFGPILPQSAGFYPVLKPKKSVRKPSRLNVTSIASEILEESATWDPQGGDPQESKNGSEYDPDSFLESEVGDNKVILLSSIRTKVDAEIGLDTQPAGVKSHKDSPTSFSPIISSPKIPSQKPGTHSKKGPISILRLSSSRGMDMTCSTSLLASPRLYNDSSSSEDSDVERTELQNNAREIVGHTRSTSYGNIINQVTGQSSFLGENDDENQSCISLPLSEKVASQSRPPKDFVCPITGQIFCDPVTLETGQTYERKAIQEWMKRGNTTCPITRQPLSATALPKTNYVLKRLITSWKELRADLSLEFSYSEAPSSVGTPSINDVHSESSPSRTFVPPNYGDQDVHTNHKSRRFIRPAVSTSPTSVISQAAIEAIISGLKPYILSLCSSEDLQECEGAVLTIAKTWKESKADFRFHSYLSTPAIVNGFVEVLSASMNREVLRMSIYILSELIFADDSIRHILTSIDSDFDCLAALLKNGLAEASVLIYMLKPSYSQLSSHDLVPSLTQIIVNKNVDSDDFQLVVDPKDSATALLEQILMGGDENNRALNATSIISANGIPALLNFLDRADGRLSVISVLLCCIKADKKCRHTIASKIELSPVLELFHAGNDSAKGICVEFLSELIQLNRRTMCNHILQSIKDEGAFSTMHTLLVYLQMAPMEQQPAIATLLLQLDLLAEPRKMSIYREEAIEALIEALHQNDFPNCQILALDALLSLTGRLTASGKSYTEAWLLKIAGYDQPYNSLFKADRTRSKGTEFTAEKEQEEKATKMWERKVAFVLCNHEKGSIFNTLEECLKSNSIEMAKSCLVIATWLIHMLYTLPDTGIRNAASKTLLDQFINILQSSKNVEDKILATLALADFISDPGALDELRVYAKCMYKSLRKLKRNSMAVNGILKALMNQPSINVGDLWSCSQGVELDSFMNGEVLSLLHIKGQIISGHSDGTMKVWDAGKRTLRLIQEVREHVKAVTCLYVSSSDDKLYSGSLDKTIRVWVVKQEEIHRVQVHDVKEPVLGLTANVNVACFFSQGTGVKVYNWSGVPKHINFNKNVKCLAMSGDKLYCGCSGYSIQEVDLYRYTSSTFYSGARKLLGKQTIHALQINNGLLIAGGSSVDGTAGKLLSLSTKAVIGTLSTGFEIHLMAVNDDFIFTATKCGIIEVWLKERVTRIACIKLSSKGHAKITSLTSDVEGEMLFAGSSDGKIQAWDLD